MPRVVQEKFQITAPPGPKEPKGWVDPASTRRSGKAPRTQMPPGPNLANQSPPADPAMPYSMAGQTDVSADTNQQALNEGYSKRAMQSTDDEYSRQHNDAFYDDVGGFVERNNMLDRL